MAQNPVIAVHQNLIAHLIRHIADHGNVRIQKVLKGSQLIRRIKERKAMHFFPCVDFSAEHHPHIHPFPKFPRQGRMTGVIVIGDCDHFQLFRPGLLHNPRGAHLQVCTRRKHRMNVQISREYLHRFFNNA
ncbi:MAG: hypothetical protein R2751_01670 [Bacteroidales bacterium]